MAAPNSGKTKTSTTGKASGKSSIPSKTMSHGTAKKPSPKTEFAQDMTKLDDKAIISDVLAGHKSLVKLYGTALCETSCEKMRTLVNSKLSECAKDQFDAFLYMNERNLYPTEPAPATKVSQAKQKYESQKCQMRK